MKKVSRNWWHSLKAIKISDYIYEKQRRIETAGGDYSLQLKIDDMLDAITGNKTKALNELVSAIAYDQVVGHNAKFPSNVTSVYENSINTSYLNMSKYFIP